MKGINNICLWAKSKVETGGGIAYAFEVAFLQKAFKARPCWTTPKATIIILHPTKKPPWSVSQGGIKEYNKG